MANLRVADAFLLTLDRRKFKIHSVQRVQNISLWQSYCVKKASIIAREDDPVRANRKYVRIWLFHGCPGDIARGRLRSHDASLDEISSMPMYRPHDGNRKEATGGFRRRTAATKGGPS